MDYNSKNQTGKVKTKNFITKKQAQIVNMFTESDSKVICKIIDAMTACITYKNEKETNRSEYEYFKNKLDGFIEKANAKTENFNQ